MRFFQNLLALVSLALSFSINAQTEYRFESGEFGGIGYPIGSRIVADIELSGPIPTWEAEVSVVDQLVSLRLEDGLQVRTLDNSVVCEFTVAFDANGGIAQWFLQLHEWPPPSDDFRIDYVHLSSDRNIGNLLGTKGIPAAPCGDSGFASLNFVPVGDFTGESVLTPEPPGVYLYRSDALQATQAPYLDGDHFNLRVSFAGRLPANQVDFDARPFIESLEVVDDRVEPLRRPLESCQFQVSTDSNGHIVDWAVGISEPFPGPVGVPPPGWDSLTWAWSLSPTSDQVGYSEGGCPGQLFGESASGGQWQGVVTSAVPSLGVLGMIMLVLGLLVASTRIRH
ncbi:hypothetical protein [Wenzhouxiangella marina]|uniref:hypothetical protein n=1 Tax=Wenzhouxiangella marina TaxID=1579979 RepID=UPI0006738169|nr:hypothetical protein [Wenzhouxiangella marina]MBB6086742.1 hypothetical protein [Wenzhouxiangella marina]